MKHTLLLILLTFSICTFSQNSQAELKEMGTLFFKDGSQVSGLIKLDDSDILFKKDENSDEIIYNANSVVKFNIINKNGSLRDYHYELIIKHNRKKIILVDDSKDKGILFFKDKTQKKGIIKIKKSKIKFKKDRDSEEQTYNFNSVYKLNIQGDKGEIDTYVYKLMVKENKTKVVLLKSVITGNVNLLSETNNYTSYDPNFGVSSGIYTAYFLSKGDDIYATKIIKPGISSGYFRKLIAPIFFSDCQELMTIINKKRFGKTDIKRVVNYYNTKCNK